MYRILIIWLMYVSMYYNSTSQIIIGFKLKGVFGFN